MENGNMTPLVPRQDGRLEWGNGVVSMLFDIAADSPVRLCNVVGRNMVPIDGRLSDDGKPVVEKDPRPIVEVCAANTGSQDNRLTLIATVAGSQLRFVSALASEPEPGSADPFRLEITQFAPYADLEPKGREFEPTASEPIPPRIPRPRRFPPIPMQAWWPLPYSRRSRIFPQCAPTRVCSPPGNCRLKRCHR